jgi:hypothetical protein
LLCGVTELLNCAGRSPAARISVLLVTPIQRSARNMAVLGASQEPTNPGPSRTSPGGRRSSKLSTVSRLEWTWAEWRRLWYCDVRLMCGPPAAKMLKMSSPDKASSLFPKTIRARAALCNCRACARRTDAKPKSCPRGASGWTVPVLLDSLSDLDGSWLCQSGDDRN